MSGTFIPAAEVERETVPFGDLEWVCRPGNTGSKLLTAVEVTFDVGQGHDFHIHPEQDELIMVRSGSIEEWIERDKRVLNAGDSVFIAANTVHAAFNVGDGSAQLTVVLGPSVGDGGYDVVDVFDEAPWNGLRSG